MESELQIAERRVQEGEGHVARAQTLLADAERIGCAATAALVRNVLATFEATLTAHRDRLDDLHATFGCSHAGAGPSDVNA